MKNKFLMLSLFVFGISFGQLTKFNYDSAGNQISVYVEIQLAPLGKMSSTINPVLQTNPIYKDVKYYPNPVKSELYMEWQTIDDNSLNSIVVYNTAGYLLKKYDNLGAINKYTLSFGDYPLGVYFVEFIYNNGEQKTFKIIKQEN